jgi:hypothetical protein
MLALRDILVANGKTLLLVSWRMKDAKQTPRSLFDIALSVIETESIKA